MITYIVLRATLHHVPMKYRCLNKKSNQIGAINFSRRWEFIQWVSKALSRTHGILWKQYYIANHQYIVYMHTPMCVCVCV